MLPAQRPVSHAGRHLGSSLLLAIVLQMGCCAVSLAQDHIQDNRYVPLDQNAPVGRVGRWSGIIGGPALKDLQHRLLKIEERN